jgi:hypothetical protein
MLKSAALVLVLGGSLFATGTSSCADVASSGCGDWWTTYSLNGASDGSYNRTTGVGSVYTSNFTNIAASQDPLTSTFSWTSNYSGSVVTNNTSPWLSSSSTVSFVPDTQVDYWSGGMSVYTNNLASSLPTDTSTSVNSALYSSGSSAYESYMAAVYAAAYGNQNAAPVVPTNPIGALAEPIVPEPSTYVGVGAGLALLLFQARRRMAARGSNKK